MIHFSRKRLPFLATGLAVALSCMPVLGEDKVLVSPNIKATPSVTARQVTMTGKVVDLHQYMTGERNSSRSTNDRTSPDRTTPSDRTTPNDRTTPADRTTPNDRTTPTDRTTPADRTRPTDSDTKNTYKNHSASNNQAQIMGLETSAGLVVICFENAPGIYATPRSDDQPSTTPGTPSEKSQLPAKPTLRGNDADKNRDDNKHSMNDNSAWLDKQVQVTGTMYEKQGVKFLVISKVTSALDSSTTPKTDNSGTIPRPDTTLPRPQ